jgi:anti-sigma regulatory factor (Ser/Thr protein kinase)
VRLAADEPAATLEFFDDGIAFDPTQPPTSPPGDTDQPELGGLGLRFIRHLMDDAAFEISGVCGTVHVCPARAAALAAIGTSDKA